MTYKKLKGFTLVELIVVIAVFGLIIAATLSFVSPAGKVFKNTQEYASDMMLIDNVQRAVADKIRFADRMTVNVGPIDFGGDVDGYVAGQVDALRKKFCIGNADSKRRVEYARDRVYVMRIDNPENFDSAKTFNSDLTVAELNDEIPGRIQLWQFDNGTLTTAKPWLITKGEYNDVSFSVSFSGVTTKTTEVGSYDIKNRVDKLNFNPVTSVAPSQFRMTVDIYEHRAASGGYQLCKTSVVSEMPVALVNVTTGSTWKQDKFQYTEGTDDTTKKNLKPTDVPTRYEFNNIGKTNDIYFTFTLPEFGS